MSLCRCEQSGHGKWAAWGTPITVSMGLVTNGSGLAWIPEKGLFITRACSSIAIQGGKGFMKALGSLFSLVPIISVSICVNTRQPTKLHILTHLFFFSSFIARASMDPSCYLIFFYQTFNVLTPHSCLMIHWLLCLSVVLVIPRALPFLPWRRNISISYLPYPSVPQCNDSNVPSFFCF